MLKQTDISKVREMAKKLLDIVDITPNEKFPFICCHPYTSTTVVYTQKGTFCDLTKPEDFSEWRDGVFKQIDKCDTVIDFLLIINKPWYLAFLKFSKRYMSKEDFSKAFGEAWVRQENPNGDINVNRKTLVAWFKQAEKKTLMNKSDYKKWRSFDAGLVVYRGVVVDGNPKGLSWTTSREQAEWFAHRYDISSVGKTGYLERLVVTDKNSILAYFSTVDEEEVIVDTFLEKNIEII